MTENHHIKKKTPHWFYLLCLIVGLACMVVAGYFLVIGLSKFGGDATTRAIIAGGAVLFHLVETLCFVGAAGFAFHSLRWRISLFGMGCVLFVFSLIAITLAQKTAIQTSMVFFDRLAALTGYEAVDLEWAFMIAGSMLFELSGIFLMMFGVSHRADQENKASSRKGQSDVSIAPIQGFGRRLRDFIDTTQVPVLSIAARFSKQGDNKRSKETKNNVPAKTKNEPFKVKD